MCQRKINFDIVSIFELVKKEIKKLNMTQDDFENFKDFQKLDIIL